MTHAREEKPTSVHHPTEIPPQGAGMGDAEAEPDFVSPEPKAAPLPHPSGGKIKRTRISGTWIAVVVALILLVFLLVFILQNLDPANIHFLGFSGSLPLAVAMLFATIAGGLLVALIGAARIFQLRKETRKARKAVR
jgi:uncharacterized integral membrane protein